MTLIQPPDLEHELGRHEALKAATLAWLGNLESPRTRRAYQIALREFSAATGRSYDATQDDVIAFKNALTARGLSQATINLKLSAISSLFNFLRDERGLVDHNPVDGVKRKHVHPYGKATALREGEPDALLRSIARDTLTGKRDYALIRLFLTTGLRLSELAQLRCTSLQRQATKVFAHFTGKGGAAETVAVGKITLDAIQDYLSARGPLPAEAPLFASHSNRSAGAPLSTRGIQQIIQGRCAAVFGAGHGITPHSLRHTTAVELARREPLGTVSKALWHKNLRVTTIYLDHVDTGAVEEAVEALDSAFVGQ